MVGPMKRYIDHIYCSKGANHGDGRSVAYTLVIEKTTMTEDQLAKLMDIVDRAAEEANQIMGW